MSRHADGKTHLETECLSKTPISKQAVQVVYDLRDSASTNPDVLRTWLKNLCLSHERMRAELDGLEVMREDDANSIRDAIANINTGNYRRATAILERLVECATT